MEFHEYANLFPMMTADEMDALKQDMREHGYRQDFPIITFENKILDGRNRYAAALAEGLEPVYREFDGDNALQYVISANLNRRHLNESQRALVASRLANMTKADAANSRWDATANLQLHDKRTQSEAAEMLNISPRLVATIKAIEKEAPDLLAKIDAGEMTAHAANKKISERQRNQDRQALAATAENIKPDDRWNISFGDMTTWQTDKRYDFIVTDPPYPKEYLHLYEVLAIRSKEWLKDGGLLVAMCGQSYLNQIYEMMSRHLIYYWTAAYLLPNQPTPLRQRQVNTSWKPLLIFAKSENYKGKIFGDVFVSDVKQGDKTLHDWGQSVIGMYSLIKQICLPGQSIFDPFCGAGTTGIAALKHGCLFDGIDTDQESVNISKGRLSNDG